MTITREQAIDIARPYAKSIGMVPYTNDPMWSPHDWVIASIIEASKPCADVQAEGSEREAFEAWIIHYWRSRGFAEHSTDAEMVKRMEDGSYRYHDYESSWRGWQAATVAHRQQQAEAKGGE